MLFIGCNTTKKTTRSTTTVTKPNTTRKTSIARGTGKVDTIHWSEIDKSKDYYDAIENLELERKSRYNISLFLPLSLDNEDMGSSTQADSKVGMKTQYYAGVKMALDFLEQEGIDLTVNVFDAEDGAFESKLQKCRDSDVIIGPEDLGQLAVAANFGKNNAIPVISPWKSSSKIAKDNPYYVQLVPGQKTHYDKIVEHAMSNYKSDQIYLLGRKERLDMQYMNYMQRVGAAINNDRKKPFKEFYIDEDSLRLGDTAFDSIFYEQPNTVFILPNWNPQTDEEFVYNVVRKMSAEKGFENVVLYGMPIMFDSEKIVFEHYRNLNMRICRSAYVDRGSPEVKQFRKMYYKKYNALPDEEAYEGYDMMILIGRHLYNYGRKFQYFMEDYSSNLLETRYDIQKVFDGKSGDDLSNVQYFQNQHLYILSFENDHFVTK